MKFATRSTKPRLTAAFTLVEVLAALLFMGIVIPVAVQGLRIASLAGEVAHRKGEAVRVAERVLNECILFTNYFQATQRGVVTEGTREFDWTLQAEVWNQTMTNQFPGSSANSQWGGRQPAVSQFAASQVPMTLLTVEVLYPVQNQKYSVRLSTLVNPAQ